MADFFAWYDWPKLEDRSGSRAFDNHWLRPGVALRTAGGRDWLLGADDDLGRSPYCLVRPRHGHFFARHFCQCEPTLPLGHRSRRNCVGRAVFLRPILAPFAET